MVERRDGYGQCHHARAAQQRLRQIERQRVPQRQQAQRVEHQRGVERQQARNVERQRDVKWVAANAATANLLTPLAFAPVPGDPRLLLLHERRGRERLR